MYRRWNRDRITVENFLVSISGTRSAENSWIKMAKLMPWDMIEDMYVKLLKSYVTIILFVFVVGCHSD